MSPPYQVRVSSPTALETAVTFVGAVSVPWATAGEALLRKPKTPNIASTMSAVRGLMLRLFDQDGIMVRQFSCVMLPAVPGTNSRL